MTDAKPVDVDGLVEALGHQRQCDEDGTDCIVSRQAVDEARELIIAQQAEIARLTELADLRRISLEHYERQGTEVVKELEAGKAERDRLTQENERLAGEWKRECDDADGLLSAIGLDPAQYRTKGGSLMVTKAANAIKEARRDEQ